MTDSHNGNDSIDNNGGEPVAFRSVLRIACILNCLSQGINTVTEIATSCQLNKSTAYRLLRAAEKAGLTMRDPYTRRYFLGPLVSEIASNPYIPHEQLVECAIIEMNLLSEYTRESIGLHVLSGFHNLLLVHEIPSVHELRVEAKNRIHTGLHTGGTSKSLLAQLNSKTLKIVLNGLDFTPLTPYSIKNREELTAQLKEVRRRGYAIDFSEKLEGVMCISVPLKNYVLPSAISILGPESRIKPNLDEYIDVLLSSGSRVRQNLSRIFTTATHRSWALPN